MFFKVMSNGGTKEAFASISMSVENEPIIPVQVKCVEVQSVQILRNPRATDSSTLRVNKSQEEQLEVPIRSVKDDVEQPSTCALEDEMPPTSPTSPTSGSLRNTLTPSRFQFDPSLSYAEKVTHEMIITERIYLDNLKQIIDVSSNNFNTCYSNEVIVCV